MFMVIYVILMKIGGKVLIYWSLLVGFLILDDSDFTNLLEVFLFLWFIMLGLFSLQIVFFLTTCILRLLICVILLFYHHLYTRPLLFTNTLIHQQRTLLLFLQYNANPFPILIILVFPEPLLLSFKQFNFSCFFLLELFLLLF